MAEEQQTRQDAGWSSFMSLGSGCSRPSEQSSLQVSPEQKANTPKESLEQVEPEDGHRNITDAWRQFFRLEATGPPEPDGASHLEDPIAVGQTDTAHIDELSDIRLDINLIQEAIRNHDLWVQDAVVMRHDIVDLYSKIQEHEDWMSNVFAVVKQMQEHDVTFSKDIADLRQQVGLGKKGVSNVADDAKPLRLQREGEADEHSKDVTSASSKTKPWTRSVAVGDCVRFRGDAPEMNLLAHSLKDQLNSGFYSLRTMVKAVEGTLLTEIDSERSNRSASIQELRQEFSSMHHRHTEGSPSKSSVATPGTSASAPSGLGSLDAAMGALRSSFDALEQKTRDKSTEVERLVNELRTELAVLRAEQQIQAVVANAATCTHGTHRTKNPFLASLWAGAAQDHQAVFAARVINNGIGDAKRAFSAPPFVHPPMRGPRQPPHSLGQRELRTVEADPVMHPIFFSHDANPFTRSVGSAEGWPPHGHDETLALTHVPE